MIYTMFLWYSYTNIPFIYRISTVVGSGEMEGTKRQFRGWRSAYRTSYGIRDTRDGIPTSNGYPNAIRD